MKKFLSIALLLIGINSHAQTYAPIHTVGSATYLDSNKGSALVSKNLILLQYKTKDSTQVLGIDSNGYIVLRTKGGGTAIVDSTVFGTHFYINSQGFLKSADILGKLNKSDSNILSGYYSYFAWLRDSSLIMNNFSNYATLTQLTNALAPYATIASTWSRTQIDSILTAKAYETIAHAAATYYPLSNPNNYVNNTPNIDSSQAIWSRVIGLTSFGISPTDLSHWNTAYNKYVTGISFNSVTGIYTVTFNDATTLTTSFDGRYLQTESDPVANAKTVTINGNTQTLGSNPNFSIPATDTSSLSTRINLKLNIADSNILKGYLSYYKYKMDSAMFAGNIALAVKYTDTALMLQNYIRTAGWGLLKIGQALLADSSLLLPRGDSNINGGYLPFWTYTQAPAYTITNTDKTHWNNAYNNYPTSISWNTTSGVLTVTLNSGATLTTSLDGRYIPFSDTSAYLVTRSWAASNSWNKNLNAFGATGKFGTSDNNNVDIYTNNVLRGRIASDGGLYWNSFTNLGYQITVGGTIGCNKIQGVTNTGLSIDISNGNYIRILNGIACVVGSGVNSFTVSPTTSTPAFTYADTVFSNSINNLYDHAIISTAKRTYKDNNTNPNSAYGFNDDSNYDTTTTGGGSGSDTVVSFHATHRYAEVSTYRQKLNYYLYGDYAYGSSGAAVPACNIDGFGDNYFRGTSTLIDTVHHHPKAGPNITDSVVVYNSANNALMLAPMPSGGTGGGSPGGAIYNLEYKSGTSTFGGTNQVNVDATDNNLIFTYNNGTTPIAAPASGAKPYFENNIGFPFFHVVDTTAKTDFRLQPSIIGGAATYATGYMATGGNPTGEGILSDNGHFSASSQQFPSYSATVALSSYIRTQIATGTTSGSSVAYYYTWPTAITTASRYVGGYILEMKFGFSTYNSTERFFAGYEATWGGAWPNVDPSTEVNIIGIGKDGADATLQWMVNDGSGVATKTNTGITPNQNDVYELLIFIPPSGGSITMQIFDITPTVKTPYPSYTATTNIPSSNVQISPKINLTNNATGANRVVDFIQCYQYQIN